MRPEPDAIRPAPAVAYGGQAPRPGPGNATRLGKDERRAQILAATRMLLRERPYESVSTAEIATAAGVSRGLVNHYYASRRDLYLAVVQDMLAAPVVRAPRYVVGATVRDRVATGVSGWMELLRRDPQVLLTATGLGGPGHDKELQEIVEAARRKAVSAVAEIVGLADLAAVNPGVRALLRGYSGLAEMIGRQWLLDESLPDDQVRVLLEESLLALIDQVLPLLTDAGHDPAG